MFVEHKEALEVTEAPAKVLKLSEAMRIGTRLLPMQGTSWSPSAPCALCTAVAGVTGLANLPACPWVNAFQIWPSLLRPTPKEKLVPDWAFAPQLGVVIEALNGFGRNIKWPRERIADWLEAQGL